MTAERYNQIQMLFDKAVELESGKREEYLKQECGNDRELYDEVMSLLSADEKSHSIFSGSAADYIPADKIIIEGRIFGNYRAVRQIGTGGMGTVFLAERADGVYEQKVALKIVKPGMNTGEIISRFESERQILARLQHPNIARLIDGGISDTGLPYFTMEYVEGKPITEYCDDKNLSIENRLKLFKKVCEAVLYAHQNLVIHRDIKPGNILVKGDGTVKLLDFGIAKVFVEEENQESLTLTGMRVMTPEYASPEQVRGEPVSTATDIYSLGIILYQLLSGCPPYEIRATSALELEKAICLTEPQKPSIIITKVSYPGSGDASKTSTGYITSKRSTSLAKLRKRISGDLDNICLTAIRKEPERRYASIAQFISDIENHLNGLPVSARKSTAAYRTRKFIQRHKTGVFAAAAALIIIASMTTYYTVRLAGERDRAQLEADKSKKVSEFLTGIFQLSDPEYSKGESITARELLDNGVKKIENELSGQPEVLADMLEVTGNVYKSLGMYKTALDLINRAYKLNDSIMGENSPETVKTLNDLANLNYDMGDYDAAIEKFRKAIGQRKNIFGEESPETAESMNDLAMVLRDEGKYDESEKLLSSALAIRKEKLSANSSETAQTMSSLALVKKDKAEYKDAEKLFKESLAISEKLYGKVHPAVTETLGNLAVLLQETGRYEEASKIFNEVLEIDKKLFGELHPTISTDLFNLASNKALMGDLDGAEKLYSENLSLDEKLLGKDHPYIALDMNNLAGIYNDKGDYEEAEKLYKQSLELNRKIYGNEHVEVATNLSNLGVLYSRWGKLNKAEPLLKSALKMRIKLLGREHPDAVTSLYIYASLLSDEKKYGEAVGLFKESLELRIKALGADHPNTANIYLGLGNAFIGQRKFREAEKNIENGIRIYREKLPEGHWSISYAESILGKCYLGEGKYAAADSILYTAYKNLLDKRGSGDRLTKNAAGLLIKNAKAWRNQGKLNKYNGMIAGTK